MKTITNKMKKLRLILFGDCDRSCDGCCNKDWDIENLPIVDSYNKYDLIMLTGGEPLIKPDVVVDTVNKIRAESDSKIIIYTAKTANIKRFKGILKIVDGVTVTLHEQSDCYKFHDLICALSMEDVAGKSMRLNKFEGIDYNGMPAYWEVRDNIRWIKECPLPKDEELMRLGNVTITFD